MISRCDNRERHILPLFNIYGTFCIFVALLWSIVSLVRACMLIIATHWWSLLIGHVNVRSCLLIIAIICQYQQISLQYSWLSVEHPIRFWLSVAWASLVFPISKKTIPMFTCPLPEKTDFWKNPTVGFFPQLYCLYIRWVMLIMSHGFGNVGFFQICFYWIGNWELSYLIVWVDTSIIDHRPLSYVSPGSLNS